jgi:hypothetical protein
MCKCETVLIFLALFQFCVAQAVSEIRALTGSSIQPCLKATLSAHAIFHFPRLGRSSTSIRANNANWQTSADGIGSGSRRRGCCVRCLLDDRILKAVPCNLRPHGNAQQNAQLESPIFRPHHDCQYVAARSALVPDAARLATQRIGDADGNAATGHRWTAEFVRILVRLAYEKGLFK